MGEGVILKMEEGVKRKYCLSKGIGKEQYIVGKNIIGAPKMQNDYGAIKFVQKTTNFDIAKLEEK